ncbi:hypothetical protein EVAR_52293_1 [Eumeta japonica]|uniref:Uncharacterized protein n=1 Tax=Eumeta variegata TaxID=151549 RepID=A0A4C1Y5L8_EUMVA|nr:hypothetical protein EVAR_52293_1 [Eumeta japonica]
MVHHRALRQYTTASNCSVHLLAPPTLLTPRVREDFAPVTMTVATFQRGPMRAPRPGRRRRRPDSPPAG